MAKFPISILNKTPYHINGNAAVTAVPVGCTEGGDGITVATFFSIKNTDATNNVLVSFDGGTNFLTLKPNQSFSINGAIKTVHIKSSAATPAYEIVCFAER